MLIDKQDLAHFIQAFVNYLPDVAADQRGHNPALRNVVGFVYIPVYQGLAVPRKQQYFLAMQYEVLLLPASQTGYNK